MELLNNAWVIGIGGGILSGFFVTVITRYLFSRRDNREYAQKVASVNREVVYALRPGISEGYIPDKEVITSLLNATARKYRVSRDDVFRPKQIAEELIKDIMDSSFISSDTKKSYCETLAQLVKEPQVEPDIGARSIEQKVVESDYRARLTVVMSTTLGLTAAMVTMLSFFTRVRESTEVGTLSERLFDLTAPSLLILGATTIVSFVMLSVLRLRRLGERKERKEGSSGQSDG